MSDNGEKNEWMNGRSGREKKINFEMQVSVMTEDNELKAFENAIKLYEISTFLCLSVMLVCSRSEHTVG